MTLELNAFTTLGITLVLLGCGGATATIEETDVGGTNSTGIGGASTQGGSKSQFGGSTSQGATTGYGSMPGYGAAPATGGFGGYGGASSPSCYVNDTFYPVGVSFTNWTDCSTCTCVAEQSVACVGMLDCVGGCDYQGTFLAVGETMYGADGCTACTCLSASMSTPYLSCTNAGCVGACTYAGFSHANGSSFMATDGCNKCSCFNGTVSCTEIACVCQPSAEYWRSYLSTSASACQTMKIACPSGSNYFSNGCGCGCEQSPECPTTFPCVTAGSTYYGAGGATSADIAIPVPMGGSSGSTGGAGSPPPPTCATPAQQARCPLTPVAIYL